MIMALVGIRSLLLGTGYNMSRSKDRGKDWLGTDGLEGCYEIMRYAFILSSRRTILYHSYHFRVPWTIRSFNENIPSSTNAF